MTDLSEFEFEPTLCSWCINLANVRFLWDRPCGHTSDAQFCERHAQRFLELASNPGRERCRCGVWGVCQLQALQVVRVA